MLQTLANLFSPAAFFNPWSLLAGLLLIAAPIIIHLIHRMRFKRVKWAAMEFLLKAQKRMKRKMIIEQLLLLILRCLLMLLVGLLVARFFGFAGDTAGKEATTTFHFAIIDDSPSMGDMITDDGGEPISTYEKGKRTLTDKIAPALAEATTPQLMDVVRGSEPDTPLPIGQLNATSIKELKDNLGQYQPATVRGDLAALIKKGGDQLAARGADTGKVLHVLSDFRAADWNEQGEGVKEQVKRLTEAGVKVHFVDVAHPYRKADKKLPAHHDNLGIVELKPNKAVVAKFEEVEFSLKLKNYGTAEVKDLRVSIRVNGDEAKGGRSVVFASIPPGQEQSEKFTINFERSGGGADNPFANKQTQTPLSEGEKVDLKKAFERFNIVTAVIESKEAGGLDADNVRHTAVEVREALPILVVDATAPEKRDAKEGEALYLKKFIASSGTSFQWNYATPADVGGADLSKYSFVLLLNVPGLSDPAVRNLEEFVRNGGGCGFWLGDQVKPADYNKGLYRDGEGLFPAPLPPDPNKKPFDQMSPDEKDVEEGRLNKLKFNINQKKLLVRDPTMRTHPALSAIYTDGRGIVRDPDELEKFYRFVTVARYWPIERLGKWTDDKAVTELMCLANEKEFKDYDREANELVQAIPMDDPENAKFAPALGKIKKSMAALNSMADPSTSMAAELFDRLLSDQRNEGDADEALYREFWQKPELADLKGKVARLRDRMKYGYPLYLTKTFGRGRVTVITTSSGDPMWTDWPSAIPGNVSFIPVMKELVNYLAGGGVDDTLVCGRPLVYKLDPDSYEAKVLRGFVTHAARPGERPAGGGANDPAPVGVNGQFDPLVVETTKEKVTEVGADGKPVTKEVERKVMTLSEANTTRPGIYLFGLEQKRAKPGAGNETVTAAEYRFSPVNIDVPNEGDLRRTNADDVAQSAPGAELHGPDDTEWLTKLQNKKTDLSSMGWLFLIILAVLVAEQALAVKLSYHSGQETMSEHSPTAAAAMRRTEMQPAAGEEGEASRAP